MVLNMVPLDWESSTLTTSLLLLRSGKKCFRIMEKKTNFMAPVYGWGSTASRIKPLRGGILLFTTKLSEIPGTKG